MVAMDGYLRTCVIGLISFLILLQEVNLFRTSLVATCIHLVLLSFLCLSLVFPFILYIYSFLNLWLFQQAALVLNASRRFRYTLDLKKEEERRQLIAKIRTHAQVIRVFYRSPFN